MIWRPPPSTLFPYTTLFRSTHRAFSAAVDLVAVNVAMNVAVNLAVPRELARETLSPNVGRARRRSREHTPELHSPNYILYRLLHDEGNHLGDSDVVYIDAPS